jgi:hypothetical protein
MLKRPTGDTPNNGPAMSSDFVLILTKSSHRISPEAAAEVTRALKAREPVVEVEVALYGDEVRGAAINTSHIIAITKELDSAPSITKGMPNVRQLRARSHT